MQQDFEKILAIAPEFSTRKSPAMTERESVLGHALTELKSVVDSLNNPVPLGVQKGGFQGNYAPVPWLRVYSPDHSKHATAGFFLAYFFAADGSCLYLSLNEGTSELRSINGIPSKMRGASNSAPLRRVGCSLTKNKTARSEEPPPPWTCVRMRWMSPSQHVEGFATMKTPTSTRSGMRAVPCRTTRYWSRTSPQCCRTCCPCIDLRHSLRTMERSGEDVREPTSGARDLVFRLLPPPRSRPGPRPA